MVIFTINADVIQASCGEVLNKGKELIGYEGSYTLEKGYQSVTKNWASGKNQSNLYFGQSLTLSISEHFEGDKLSAYRLETFECTKFGVYELTFKKVHLDEDETYDEFIIRCHVDSLDKECLKHFIPNKKFSITLS